jgi:hypothetical protein
MKLMMTILTDFTFRDQHPDDPIEPTPATAPKRRRRKLADGRERLGASN